MRIYANLVALRGAMEQKGLPAGYYARVEDPNVGGITPKDMWLQCNVEYALENCRDELRTRGLMDKFTVFVLC